MLNKSNRIICGAILVGILTTSIVGCSNKSSTAPLPATKTDISPITFTAFSSNSSVKVKWGEDPVSKEITKKTGVTLDINYSSGGDGNAKINVMSASGSLPDIIFSIDNSAVSKLITAKQLVPLDNYIDKDGTNIKKVFGNQINRMKYAQDGKTYGFNKGWNSMPFNPPGQINIQLAVLKDAGYPKITTLDEVYNLIKNYKAKYPKINGKDTIGVESWGDSYGWSTTIGNTALRTAGYHDDGDYIVDPTTLQAKLGLTSDPSKAYFQWLNKLYNENLLDKESFIQKSDSFNAKVTSGRVLVTTDAYWDLGGSETALRKAGMPERAYAKLPIYTTAEAAAKSRIMEYDPSGTFKTVITTTCKNSERAFKFFDEMWSSDMQTLVNWGIKDVNYTVDANGKKALKEDVIKLHTDDKDFGSKTGIQLYDNWSVGAGVKDAVGNYINPWDTPEMQAATYTAEDKECLKAYKSDALTWSDLAPKATQSPYGFAWTLTLPSDSAGALAEQKIDSQTRIKQVPKAVMSKNSTDFETSWAELVKMCNDAGISSRETEVTNGLKERVKLWGTSK